MFHILTFIYSSFTGILRTHNITSSQLAFSSGGNPLLFYVLNLITYLLSASTGYSGPAIR